MSKVQGVPKFICSKQLLLGSSIKFSVRGLCFLFICATVFNNGKLYIYDVLSFLNVIGL